MATPQSLTQGFIQNSAGTQTAAQNAQPLLANNGNPNTVYNQTPMGGYLPPVANAYDQWRINPGFGGGGGFLPAGFDWGTGGNGFPVPTTPAGGGGNWRPPVLPPTTPPTGGPAVTPPTGGPAVPPGGPQVGQTLLGGQRRGLGVDLGWGGTGIPHYSAISTGLPNTSGFNTGRWGMNGLLGSAVDWLLPGDAVQGGHINWANLGLGIVDQYTGLPVTQGLGWLTNTNWAQTSPNAVARWLRNWRGENDSAAMQDWYRENGYVADDGTGWLGESVRNTQAERVANDVRNAVNNARPGAWLSDSAVRQQQAATYAQHGAAAFVGRTNPLTGRQYSPRDLQQISQDIKGNPGIGLRAAGAFAPWGSTGIQGEAARDMWAGMKDGIWSNIQSSNAVR